MMRAEVSAFVGVAAALIVAPGPDMALVTRNALTLGRRAAYLTSFGTCTGLLVHGAAATVGLSAIVATSALAFEIVKIAGAIYLALLGILTLRDVWRSRRRRGDNEDEQLGSPSEVGTSTLRMPPFRQGVLTNVLNPKVAIFFLSFLPQFIPAGQPVATTTLVLSAIFIAMTLAWLVAYASAVLLVRRFFLRSSVRRFLETVTGSVLLLLGVRLGLVER